MSHIDPDALHGAMDDLNTAIADNAATLSQPHRRRLGDTLRAKRLKASFSQEKLAEQAGLSTVFISRIERGKESPSVDSLVKIAKALGVRAQDLLEDV